MFKLLFCPSLLQLRESIAQDQEKTELLKSQMQEMENKIQNLDAKIQNTENTLKDLNEQQNLISNKSTERSTLMKEKERQHDALGEEESNGMAKLLMLKAESLLPYIFFLFMFYFLMIFSVHLLEMLMVLLSDMHLYFD